MYCIKKAFDEDIVCLVELTVSQFRTRQILTQSRESIATSRELLSRLDRLVGSSPAEAERPAQQGPLASPGEPA